MTTDTDAPAVVIHEHGGRTYTAEELDQALDRIIETSTLGAWLTRDPENIYEALAHAMVELPAIGKGSKAAPEMGGYAYRGIEAITAEAQAVLGRLGVVCYPIIKGGAVIVPITVAGKPWTETTMRIKYRFVHGPSGTKLTVGGKKGFIAIARDQTDKGPNKCMTQAYKYALLQTLMIGDKNDDSDSGSPASDVQPPEAWEYFGYQSVEDYETIHTQVSTAWAMLSLEQAEEVRAWLASKDVNRKWPMPATVADELFDRLRALAAQEAAGAPDGPEAAVRHEQAPHEDEEPTDGHTAEPDVDAILDADDIAKSAGVAQAPPPAPARLANRTPEPHEDSPEVKAAQAVADDAVDAESLRIKANRLAAAHAAPRPDTPKPPEGATAEWPSWEDLYELGITEDQRDTLEREIAPAKAADLTGALERFGLPIDGTAPQRKDRLARQAALQMTTPPTAIAGNTGGTDAE
jgi:hypothetical protein